MEGTKLTPLVTKRDGTLSAVDASTGETIFFLDLVYDGRIVHVYRSVDDAAEERGFLRKRRVLWTPTDGWTLVDP